MRKLLNTLYVTTQGAYLARDGDTIHVNVERETRLRVPIHTLEAVSCFGAITASGPLMGLCAEHGVRLTFFTEYGRFLARVEGPVSGNVLLRRTQYRAGDDPARTAALAHGFVAAKIANSRTMLLRAAREAAENTAAQPLREAADYLARLLRAMRPADPLDTTRGREGDAARAYFKAFDHAITAQKDHFQFHLRTRRPPRDNTNALLSFLYALLANDAAAALEGVGLDPAVGFLHRDRPGRPGLALDLMEEFRAFLADRLVLALINRRQVNHRGFNTTETGAVHMDDDTRKTVLLAWQKRKQEEITHPFLQEKVPIGLIPHAQALLLARHLRGDLPQYPPFIHK